jgi:hypothetical protein
LFKYEDGDPRKLQFCKKNSILCSKLRDITDTSFDFCKNMGFEINEKLTYDEEFFEEITQSNKTTSPICFNGISSAIYYGPATKVVYRPESNAIRLSLINMSFVALMAFLYSLA